ncbi:MAG: ABC transporter ATP-binding protein [Arcobacter sp.]|jgi:ABC-2 type transport system ATP-binding protein|uniref:ABC transporter ATP-binding protein n=1 Tax=Aliarcobacter TaxID=2321111 RepID=UPI00112F70A9|nr:MULTISPECIES: ABC transporter ATP-binding protein [Aliarcobacter]MBK6303391.1 ABC transporter ATP-binding protein [Arcobacter sp.]MBP6289099.1 ABC transporter ATP-binding protein [Aliarcobacter sp.]TXH78821.1 MAG: ABC transporter ATP-binding protein [Romboutsia sp.]MBK6548012.1 ABC transporter ATP-binding protein [Arcobacter sp.]MBP7250834.1 ABC transporter ATP-binding protein [Aliarcobacter sp.]
MIKIKNLTKTFGVQNSLDNISLELNKGDSVIIMGQNGAGKTTLIRSILGQYIPSSGTIEVAGNNPFKNRVDTISKVGFVPQLPPPIKLTVEELINFAIHSSNISKKSVVELCLKMDLDLNEHMKKVFFKLSGGMKQKLLIAIAIAKNPEIFIFDEPTANLDPKGRENFYEIIKEYNKNRLIIFISHRIEEVLNLVNRKIELDLGKVILDEKI